MTIAEEKFEEARDYVRKRQGTIDEWQSKEQGCLIYGVSFWVWKGKECLGKIMKAGADLVGIVAFLRERERTAIDSGVIPKMAPPPPPAPPPTNLYDYCPGCGSWTQRGSTCCTCGMWVP